MFDMIRNPLEAALSYETQVLIHAHHPRFLERNWYIILRSPWLWNSQSISSSKSSNFLL